MGVIREEKDFSDRESQEPEGYGWKGCGGKITVLFLSHVGSKGVKRPHSYTYTNIFTAANFRFSEIILNLCLEPVAWLLLTIKTHPFSSISQQ